MDQLAELRERRALTLRELGEMSGVAADTINQIELGHRKPRPSTLRKLARALEVDVEELVRPKASAPSTPGQPEIKESRAATHLSSSGEATPDPVTVDRNKLVALLRDRAGMSDEEEIDETIRRLKVAA